MSVTIKTERNGASSPGTIVGEVRTFAAGAVPEGWQQISGAGDAAVTSPTGIFLLTGILGSTGIASPYQLRPVVTALGRIFALSANQLFEMDVEYAAITTPVAVPMASTSWLSCLISLGDGNLLRLGGNTAQGANSGITQRYNAATRSFQTLAAKPAANMNGANLKAACAADGWVYGMYGAVGTATYAVDAFNPVTNQWIEGVATAPFTTDSCTSLVQLPSGKLLFMTAAGMWKFDTATRVFTALNAQSGYLCAVSTPRGFRAYNFSTAYAGTSVGISWLDYDETLGATSIYDAKQLRPMQSVSGTGGVVAITNPATGATLIKCLGLANTADLAITHHLSFTPRGTVTAVKTA